MWNNAGLGLISGTLAAGFSALVMPGPTAFALLPGIVFALLLPAYWLRLKALTRRQSWLLGLGAVVGNGAGFWTAFTWTDALSAESDWPHLLLGCAAAGALGSALTLLAALPALHPRRAWRPFIVGAALGALAPGALVIGWPGVVLFYALWQAGFAATLGYALRTGPGADYHPDRHPDRHWEITP